MTPVEQLAVLTAAGLPAGVTPLDGSREALAEIVGAADVVGVGESVHLSGGLERARSQVTETLVAELGFRVGAMELSWLEGQVADEQLLACSQDAWNHRRRVEETLGVRDDELRRCFGAWVDNGQELAAYGRAHPGFVWTADEDEACRARIEALTAVHPGLGASLQTLEWDRQKCWAQYAQGDIRAAYAVPEAGWHALGVPVLLIDRRSHGEVHDARVFVNDATAD